MIGILDRFEDDLAVILIESKQDELTLSKETLPAGSTVGTAFNISLTNGTYSVLSINETETKKAETTSAQLVEKLKQKKKSSKFKRR